MTMLPVAQNLSKQHLYSGHMKHWLQGYDCSNQSNLVFVDPLIMVEEKESRRSHDHESNSNSTVKEASGGSSTKEKEEVKDNESWLQLSIGSTNNKDHHQSSDKGELMELSLLPAASSEPPCRKVLSRPPVINITTRPSVDNYGYGSLFESQPQHHHHHHLGSSSSSRFRHHNWIYPSSSDHPSSSSFMAPPIARVYIPQSPFQIQDGASIDFRVIDPPPRPHSGIWFMLKASQDQAKEPYLPQIPKSYLRIKDGRMTIRLVMKYLANKLSLESESEVEIRCREQEVGPTLTLQDVRDNLWNLRNTITSSTTHYHLTVMVLHYGRRLSSSSIL